MFHAHFVALLEIWIARLEQAEERAELRRGKKTDNA